MTAFAAVFVAAAVFCGIAGAAFLAGIAIDRRRILVMLGTTLLCGVALGLSEPALQLGTSWIAASVALNASLSLAQGAMERLLLWAVGPGLLLALFASHSGLSSLQPMPAAVALLVTSLASVWAGWRLRRLRRRAWFSDISMLTLLTAVALMAAPTLLLGWRRASVAAEGQDAATASTPALWPLAISAIAFLFGLSWRTWMRNRSKRWI